MTSESNEKKSVPIKVLVVDHDRDLGSLLLDILKNFGFIPVFAANATDAVNEIKMHPDIKIILVDWSLPDMQGEKVIKNFIKFGATCPIIVMSAQKTKDSVVSAIKSGARYYMVKPLNIGQLVLKMNTIAGRSMKSNSLESFTEVDTRKTFDFDAYLPITVIDVSQTGCAFEAPIKIPVNSVAFMEMEGLALKLELPKFTSFSVRTANCKETTNNFKIGAQFIGLPSDVHSALEKLCCELRAPERSRDSKIIRKKSSPEDFIDRINILLIDDSEEELETIGNMLECEEYNVLRANNAADGMKKLEVSPAIDVIILDWIMPDVDGIGFLKRTRKIVPYTPDHRQNR